MEGLKGELEAVSRQMLEEERMGAGKEDVNEIQGRMMVSRLVEHWMDEEMIDEDDDTLGIKPSKNKFNLSKLKLIKSFTNYLNENVFKLGAVEMVRNFSQS